MDSILILLLLLLARPLTVLLHELGHAFPAIWLTKQKVAVYIGSLGDPGKSLQLNTNRLAIFFRYNPFAWNSGVCIPSATSIPVWHQIIYILAGPLASLLCSGLAFYLSLSYDLHGVLKFFLVVLIGSSILDLLVNLIPSPVPIRLYNGSTTYNDGYNLKQLFRYRRVSVLYEEAAQLYQENKYADAAGLLEKSIGDGVKEESIYRLAISCFQRTKDYDKARALSVELATISSPDTDDFSSRALSCTQLGLLEEALEYYDLSLQLNPDHPYSLNNKGYTLLLQNRFDEAIPLLEKAIGCCRDFAYAYNNLGFAKMKLGRQEEGVQDIRRSLEMDDTNPYAHRNLGIYYLESGQFDEALLLFEKAKQINETTPMIDELVEKATYCALQSNPNHPTI